VKLHFENATPYSITQNSSKEAGQMPIRVFAVVKYLQEYGAASTAYNDLREFVERLNIEERKKLLSVLRCNNIFGGSEKLDDGQVMFEEESYPNDQDVSSFELQIRLQANPNIQSSPSHFSDIHDHH